MWFLFLFVCFIRISSSVTKCLFCTASFQNKIGYFVILYCSPSQNHNSLQDVLKKFEKHPDTSIQRRDVTVIVGDFNVTVWWHNHQMRFTNIKALTSYNNFDQVIKEPTHILASSVSYIDLTFTNKPNLIFISKPNLIFVSGTLPSLKVNFYHRIVYSKFNLEVGYSPSYQHLVLDY